MTITTEILFGRKIPLKELTRGASVTNTTTGIGTAKWTKHLDNVDIVPRCMFPAQAEQRCVVQKLCIEKSAYHCCKRLVRDTMSRTTVRLR